MISSFSSGYSAKNSDLGITVSLTKKSGGTALFVASYDEPYDASKANDWNEEVKEDITDHLDNHAIPFVYLGTANPYSVFTQSTNKLSIYGGKWNDDITAKAEEAFTQAGYTFTKSSDNKSFTSEISLQDGCKMAISIYSNRASSPRAFYDIIFTEAYNPGSVTDWDADTKYDIKDYLDNHLLPVIYLEAKTCTTKYSSSYGTLTITGGAFNPLMIENAKSVFEADGWTIDTTEAETLSASKDFDDGCRIHAQLKKDKSGKACLVTRLVEKFNVPEEATDWDEDTKAFLAKNFDGHGIPYFYLGVDQVSTSFSGTQRYGELTGDIYNEHMIDEAKKAFEAKGWAVTLGENNYGKTFSATKTEEDGDVLKATLNAVTTSAKAKLKIEIDEAYAPLTGEDAKWSDEVTKSMTQSFHGFILPYVYLGTKNVYSSYNPSDSKFTLVGGGWSDSIFQDFEASLKADTAHTWEIKDETLETYGSAKTATYKNTDENYAVTMTLYKTTYNHPTIVATFQDVFEVPQDGAWDSTALTTIKENLNGNEIPYFYLGTMKPNIATTNRTDMTKTVKITGGKWNNQVISLAEATLKANGFETNVERRSGLIYAEGIRVLEDKSQIRISIHRNSSSSLKATAILEANYDVAPTQSAATDWDTTTKKALTDYLGEEHLIPYIDLGSGATITHRITKKTTTTASTFNYDYYTIKNISFTSSYITQAKTTLETNGFSVEQQISKNNYSSGLIATKTFEDGIKVKLSIYGLNNKQAYLYVSKYEKFEKPASGAWQTKTSDLMAKHFNGTILPYVYLGTTNETCSYNSTEKLIRVYGDNWDDSILEDAKTALLSDTKFTWQFNYEYTNYNQKKLLAFGQNEKTGDSFSVTIYNAGGSWTTHGADGPYMEVKFQAGHHASTETQWDNDTLTYMNDLLNGNIIPYFNIGDNVKCSTSLSTLSLTTEGFSEEIFASCEAALKGDTERTWTITYNPNGTYGKTLYASCTTKDGGKLSLSLYHYKYVSSGSGGSTNYNQTKVDINYSF